MPAAGTGHGRRREQGPPGGTSGVGASRARASGFLGVKRGGRFHCGEAGDQALWSRHAQASVVVAACAGAGVAAGVGRRGLMDGLHY
jgi:hypothetical protein